MDKDRIERADLVERVAALMAEMGGPRVWHRRMVANAVDVAVDGETFRELGSAIEQLLAPLSEAERDAVRQAAGERIARQIVRERQARPQTRRPS